jgi:NADH-quinone oxidoreductase subunit G
MPLPFNSLRALRAAMYAEFPHLAQVDQIVSAGIDGTRELAGRATKTESARLTSPIGDFYLTNPIARSSAIMAECSQMQAGLKQAAE